MSKKKKTRQQKIIADLRRQVTTTHTDFSSNEGHQPTVLYTPTQKSIYTMNTNKQAYTISYSDISHDLSKTSLLTFAIIAFDMVLFFLLKNHFIRIPFVQF